MRILVLVFLIWQCVASVAETEVSKRSLRCQEYPGFNSTWTVLASNETILQREFENIGRSAGYPPGPIPMTNCRVEFTVDDRDREIDGERTMLMDKLWYQGSTKRHMGILIHYSQQTVQENGATLIRKRVSGYSICRTADACEKLRIPF